MHFPSFHRPPPSIVRCGLSIGLLLTTPTAWAQVLYSGVVTAAPVTGLSAPKGLAVDSLANLYIADSTNNRIVKLTPAGVQSVALSGIVAGLALKTPAAVAVDSTGNLYVADTGNNRVLKVPSAGAATTVGTGLLSPAGLAVDEQWNGPAGIYISDTGHNRVVYYSGGTQSDFISATTLIAGLALKSPTAIATQGNELFIADTGNNRVLTGYENYFNSYETVGTGLSGPTGVSAANDHTYIADRAHNRVLFEFHDQSDDTYIQIVLNSGLLQPQAIVPDRLGNIYIADTGNNRIQKIIVGAAPLGKVNVGSTSGVVTLNFVFLSSTTLHAAAPVVVTTLGATGLDYQNAGGGTCMAQAYAAGAACTVRVFLKPTVAGERSGAVVLRDTAGEPLVTAYLDGFGIGPQIIYSPPTQTTIVAGTTNPQDVSVDGAGNVYVADAGKNSISKVPPTGTTTVVANIREPMSVPTDGGGNLYVNAIDQDGYWIGYIITPWGTSSTISAPWDIDDVTNLAVDFGNNLYEIPFTQPRILVRTPALANPISGLPYYDATEMWMDFQPRAATGDASGNLYILDETDWLLWKVAANGSWSSIASGLNRPAALAVDGFGNVYVADFGNNQVVQIAPSGAQTKVPATLSQPAAVAADGKANLYVADLGNKRVVKIERSTPPTMTFASTAVGKTSTDSPKQVTIQNTGNANLIFAVPLTGQNPTVSANFKLGTGNTCPQLTPTSSAFILAPGKSCVYNIIFSPTAAGTITGSLTITDNNLNGIKVTQSIPLKGTATAATAAISLDGLNRIYTGRPLAVSATTSPSGLPVTITYNGSATPPTPAGTYAVKAVSADPAYQGSATGTLVIARSTPDIVWINPKPIAHGSPLSSAQLCASASVPGRFTYTPGAGTILPKGRIRITARFTPNDSSNYNAGSASAFVLVK